MIRSFTINKYLFKNISKGLALSTVVFVSLILLLGFIAKIYIIGKGDFTISSALIFTLLTIPNEVYHVFPVSSVVGVLLGLGLLAESSELIVLQSVGFSRIRIALITCITLVIWLIPLVLMGEYVVPPMTSFAESYKETKLHKNSGYGLDSGIWIREGLSIINVGNTLTGDSQKNKNSSLNQIKIFKFNEQLDLNKVIVAKTASINKNIWELTDVTEISLSEFAVKHTNFPSKSWQTNMRPEMFKITYTNPKILSIRDILKYKEFKGVGKSIPKEYQIALWSKVFYFLLVIATALTGLPFLFGLIRTGGFGKRVLIGVLLGVILNLIHRSLLNMGEVFHMPAYLVTVFPSVMILTGVFYYLKKAESQTPL